MIRLHTVDTLLKESNIFTIYGINMHEVITDIYNGLMNNSLFVEQMKQPLNDKQTLYAAYKENVEALIQDTIDPDKGDQCMLKYNLMRDDFMFYDKWRKELFELIYNELAGK